MFGREKRKRKRRQPNANGPLVTLIALFGAFVPCLLAVALISISNATRRSESVVATDMPAPVQETMVVPIGSADAVVSSNSYHGTVRLILEGRGSGDGTTTDAFYTVPDNGATARLQSGLSIDGQPALDALGLRDDPPPYAEDHLYAVLYDAGATPRPIAFQARVGLWGDSFWITLVQVD